MMHVRYLLFLVLLVSCMPESQVSKGNLSSSGTSTDGSGTIPEAITQWNFLGTLSKNITINASNLNNSYIVGKEIETFLSTPANFTQDYCLISRFVISGNTHEVRTRVVPTSYYDFTAKRTVKILRADFNDLSYDSSTLQYVCSGLPEMVLDSSGNYISNPVTITSTTSNPAALCPTCSSTLTSSKLILFRRTALDLKELPLANIDIRALNLLIDPNSTTGGNATTCTQTDCASRGFDCCLDNQCITDGAVRSSASTLYSSQLLAAEQERLNNPLSYLNYPHLYYICGSTVPSTTGGSTGGGSYTQGLSLLNKDYFCVQHMKQYKTAPTFHQDVLNAMSNLSSFFPDKVGVTDVAGVPATLYPLDIECRNNTASPSAEMHFEQVTKRLYQNCGCAQTTLAGMVAYCPAYEYSVNYFESNGLPNRIDCLTPNSNTVLIPSQQTVTVNSRSAPHRYFRSCGDEFGSTANCVTGDNQEGDYFDYQDAERVLPSQENFGMNAILGQMTVTLDKALPAKAVNIELDQVYLISTTSGFYSPCPTCGKDSWFSSFSAYPTTAYGVGLQSVGFSTQRDLYDGNTSGGNSEDTIFGRACWLPPTMLPFSHYPKATVQDQRLDRLKTQAALYSNGYQRDWYGFNKGALIGSFDGVTWFAVGKGRIARSTSNKLFLAINAPFADVATPTLHVVNVQAYDGLAQAAQVDYDPQYHNSHPYQNEAGTCQANHMCSTDTDCVTKLGWEYMCASVQDVKTLWPEFDTDAKEVANTSDTLTIDQVLLQKHFPSSSTKRCVYRGAGAPCVVSPGVVSDLNKRKTLTCAPNFYCANVNSTTSEFNGKISRYASLLENIPVIRNHLYGKDANVLGRPLSYVKSSLSTNLPPEVRTNLIQNMATYQAGVTATTGLCQPGKALPQATGVQNELTYFNPYNQHVIPDVGGRTDFINQIAGCNSGLFTQYRYSSCPVIGTDGNHEYLSSAFTTVNYQNRARSQNSCGLDSLLSTAVLTNPADTLLLSSPFKTIESKPLANTTIVEPTFARDACLRRTGQVCHTDLDCGPNKMHANIADNLSVAYFGNEAEKKYNQEYLVCGQTDPKPSPLDSVAYKAYDMSLNRCCREVGKDLTTYTSYIPNKIVPTLSSTDHVAGTFGLKGDITPGITPNDPLRYSRLSSVENLGTATRPQLNASQVRAVAPNLSAPGGANVSTPNQWKTLNEANSESCCGGGWIRKFSDGTNDWSRRDRVYIDVNNFSCINSRTSLLTHPSDVNALYYPEYDAGTLVNQDKGDYCKDATGIKGACAQYTVLDNLADTPPSPSLHVTGEYRTAFLNFVNFGDLYFHPRTADGNSATYIDMSNTSGRRNIQIRMPSFVTRIFDNHLDAQRTYCVPPLYTSWDRKIGCTAAATATAALPNGPFGGVYGGAIVSLRDSTMPDATPTPWGQWCNINTPGSAQDNNLALPLSPTQGYDPSLCEAGEFCCIHYDRTTRILKVIPGPGFAATSGKWLAHFNGRPVGAFINPAVFPAVNPNEVPRTKPGTNTYYLKRLGKLELSGIPQITYPALTCNDNSSRLVPGIFRKPTAPLPGDLKITDFNANDFSFDQTNTDPLAGISVSTERYTNQYGLDHDPVFSENDFKCCTPLGKTTDNKTKCCSGYGANVSSTKVTCSLPSGTDLMVYFNRYVSNEGVGADKPGGGLLESDFYTMTGEPIISTPVNAKISALGTAYCQSGKVRQGGAFGKFSLEPAGNDTNASETIYGIVDSPNDLGTLSNAGGSVAVGYTQFMAGFRWNHHLYCDETN